MTSGPVDLHLRRAGPSDLEDLVSLHERTATEAYAHVFPPALYPFPAEAVIAEWSRTLHEPDVEVTVATLFDDAVGTITVRQPHLEHLFVLPEHWGCGIGEHLHRRALDQLQRQGVSRGRLIVLESNLRARGFYEKRGWRPDGIRHRSAFPPFPFALDYVIGLTPDA